MRTLPLILLALATPLLSAGSCTKRDVVVNVKPPVRIVETRYVPIPAELTDAKPIPSGRVSEAIEVARARKVDLQECYGDKAQIRAIQGTKAPC